MPGVHVRGVSNSDRAGTLPTQPTLNVPGSYWLSHKQNIYKFTFKYLEPTRENKEFLYRDELMKVIRRIIKCQPNQGQLSTVHLFINFKHTFWTRQDKMFAMLKFRNRQDATVFPQAFILTISVIENQMESHINDMPIKSDPNLDCKDNGPVKALQNSPKFPEIQTPTEVALQETENFEKFNRRLKRSNYPNNPENATKITPDTIAREKSPKKSDTDGLLNTSEPLRSTPTKWTRNRTRRRRDTWASSSELHPMERYNKNLEPGITSTNNTLLDNQKALPKDTFNTQQCSKLNKSTEEKDIAGVSMNSEPATPRSSNITDQVMEGLMFTIKQVENNVKVVEQRTKMELDEVLENSEKVETKEGEKSLVNSSLLRLENLVTKIEISDKQIKDPKMPDTVPIMDSLTLLSYYPVLNHNGLISRPVIREHANIPIHTTNRSLFENSLNSSCKTPVGDQRLDKFHSPINGLVPTELVDASPADEGENITKEYSGNLTMEDKTQPVTPEISEENTTGTLVLENNNVEKNSEHIGTGEDNNNDNNNNSNDNKNNNSKRNSISKGEVQINMWKLVQDITRGVKVMVERISDTDIRNATRSSTTAVSASPNTGRRIITRSKK